MCLEISTKCFNVPYLNLFRHDIRNVVPRMSIETLFKPLLIQEVSNESHRTSQNEYAVESADLDKLVGLFHGETAAVSQHINHR